MAEADRSTGAAAAMHLLQRKIVFGMILKIGVRILSLLSSGMD
jgi:hypothetical protein